MRSAERDNSDCTFFGSSTLNVDKVILSLFYKYFIESVLTFAFIAW